MARHDRNLPRRSVYISDEMWAKTHRAAAKLEMETGDTVSKNELVRQGLERVVDNILDGDEG